MNTRAKQNMTENRMLLREISISVKVRLKYVLPNCSNQRMTHYYRRGLPVSAKQNSTRAL